MVSGEALNLAKTSDTLFPVKLFISNPVVELLVAWIKMRSLECELI